MRVKPDWFLLTHCSPTLNPTVISNDPLLGFLVNLFNILFRCNYRTALNLCRLFNI
jgi:hypothetical protein